MRRGSYKARSAQEAEEFKTELEQNIRNFEVAARTSFSFGARVAVQVSYAIADVRIHAAIIELENGRLPERVSFLGDAGYARAITADSYAAMVSGGNIPAVLPEPSPRNPKIGVYRAADMRRAELRTNMAGVVGQVALQVKTFFHKDKYS